MAETEAEKSHHRKNTITFLKTDKLLLNQIQNVPYDGMATKRKKVGVTELIVETSKPKQSNSNFNNFVERSPFPLIETISNRKMLNHNKQFVRKLLISNKLPLPQEEKNTIKYKLYKLSPRKFQKDQSYNRQSDYMEYKKNILGSICNTIKVTRSITDRYAKVDTPNNYRKEDLIINPQIYKNKYRENNLRYHLSNLFNRQFLYKNSEEGDDNYVRNAYKIIIPDMKMRKIKNDVASLKFNDKLKKIEA